MRPRIVTTGFLLLICGTPLAQIGWEVTQGRPLQALDVFGFPREERLRQFEQELREASFVHELVSPHFQAALLAMGKGNEKAIVGNDGWLYYRDDLDLITRPGFLAAGAAEALDAVADLRDQLLERGIDLLFVPLPTKSMTDLGHLSRWTADVGEPRNTDHEAFFAELSERGVHWVDLGRVLESERAASGDLFLARDTHWTPRSMEAAARAIGERARELLTARAARGLDSRELSTRTVPVESDGDMVGMLRVPEGTRAFEPMRFDVQQVVDRDGDPVGFAPGAEVLLMGDSFTGVFSDPRFELGEHGGLGEHVSLALGAPLDVIMIAGGAARSVRESLARRASLAEKKLVIWQVSQRDFLETDGRWQRVPLGGPESSTGGSDAGPETGGAAGPVEVVAEIVEVSRVPDGFEYDFCLAIYEYRVVEAPAGAGLTGPLWVAHVAVEGFEDRPGGAYPVGARQRLVLEDTALHHDLERTSFVDDTNAGRKIWFATAVETAD